MRVKRRLSKKAKRKIWDRDKNECKYCGRICTLENISVDHILPLQRGGTDHESNLVTACRNCNQEKNKREEIVMVVYRR